MAIKMVAFDLGGVFVPEKNGEILEAVATKAQVEAKTLMKAMEQHQLAAMRGEKTLLSAYQVVAKEVKSAVSGETLFQTHVESYQKFCMPFNESLLEWLGELRKKCRVVCLSNVETEIVALTKPTGLYDRFDDSFLSCEMGFRKPEPEIFKKVVEQTGILAKDILFVDDRAENTESAATLGFQTHLYTDELQFHELIRIIMD